MGLCEKHMPLSLITVCEATVLFFDLLVSRSPDVLTKRNLPFYTHSAYNRFSVFREDCKNIYIYFFGGVGGMAVFSYALNRKKNVTIFHKI